MLNLILDWYQEVRDIQEGLLQRSQHRNRFTLVQQWATRSRDIRRAMLDVNPQIVHFSGHGDGEEGLAFEDETGNIRFVDAGALAELFELFIEHLECVVLNACYSEVQAKAISQNIPYVLGMSQAIDDRAAIEFSVGFYDALGAGRDIEQAYKFGCNAIRLYGIEQSLVPVLRTRDRRLEPLSPPNIANHFPDAFPSPHIILPLSEPITFNPPSPELTPPENPTLSSNPSSNNPSPIEPKQSQGCGCWRASLGFITIIFSISMCSVLLNQENIVDQMSFGDKILVKDEEVNCQNPTPNFEENKNMAMEYMQAKEYSSAEASFEEARKECFNAPETLIYLSNAAIGYRKAYTLAVNVPITGSDADDRRNALMMLRGFAQAQYEINKAGGINGVQLKLIIIDDKDNVNTATEIAHSIVGDDDNDGIDYTEDILAVLGHWTSNVSEAVAPIYSGKIVFITPISITEKLDNIPDIYRVNPTSNEGGQALTSYMLNVLKKRKAIIFYDSRVGYSSELMSKIDAFIHSGGGEVIERVDLSSDLNLKDDSRFQQAIQENSVLILIPSSGTVREAIEVMEVNQGRLPLIGDMANLYVQDTLNQRQDVEEMVLAPSWNIRTNPDLPFTEIAGDLWGNAEVSWSAAMSYNTTQAIIQALKAITNQGLEPTRDAVREKLENLTVNGVSGTFTFSPSGAANTEVQLVQICPINPNDDNTKYQFIPLPPNPTGKCPD